MNKGKVLITGPNSMIGRAVCQVLEQKNYEIKRVDHGYDLGDMQQCIASFNIEKEQDYCVHLASLNGNIDFNSKYPADIFYETSQIGLNILKCCQLFKVKKVISILSSCSYPNNKTDILKEENFSAGLPHNSVESHGLAKRVIFDYSRQLNKQYNLNAICVVLNTVFGPWDNFDVNKTKVIGGLIKKFIDASKKNGTIDVWSDGSALREFIYVEDAARLIVKSLEEYNDNSTPLNLGAGIQNEISIKDLVYLIGSVVDPNKNWNIKFDLSKPTGQKRKLLDNSRMIKLFGEQKFISLKEGLLKTIDWYKENVRS